MDSVLLNPGRHCKKLSNLLYGMFTPYPPIYSVFIADIFWLKLCAFIETTL